MLGFSCTLVAVAGAGGPDGVHRKHHQYTDVPGDPHSPREGVWWSHILRLFPRPREPQWTKMICRYSKDLLKIAEGVLRTTVLIDPKGRIVHVWNKVKAAGHAEAVAAKLAELQAAGNA